MSSFFRRVSKSKIGTFIMAGVLLAILVGFALADLSNFGTGKLGFGLDNSTLAEIGNQNVTDREMREAMQRRLAQAREQRPDADYPSLAQDFDPLLAQMIDQRAIIAFARKYGFNVSKRLIDAEISDLPGVRGLNGQPSVQGYQAFLAQNRLSDQQVRELLSAEIVARYLLLPVSAGTRVPVGVATPYAAMLLEHAKAKPRSFRLRRSSPGSSRPMPTSSVIMPQTAPATWSPNNGYCAWPGSVPSKSLEFRRPPRRSKLITRPTRRPTPARKPGR